MVESFLKNIAKNLLNEFKHAVKLIFSSVAIVITVLLFSLVLHVVPLWLVIGIKIVLLSLLVYTYYMDELENEE